MRCVRYVGSGFSRTYIRPQTIIESPRLGNWALTALVAMAPVGIPRLAQISLDARIVGLGLAATVATGLAVGVMPALHLSRVSEQAGLNRVGWQCGWQRVTARGNGRRALVLAPLLSMIGVYGLTASDVSARWRELAVRLALGASRRAALWTVVRPCAVVLAIGTALGLVGAVSVGPALASLLHGVRPADVPTLAAAPIVLVALGLVAALLAATRVLRTDPAVTLRSD